MADLVELLFFDTFAHENTEELNLDLVQFPKPVYVTEIRIIPLGARVEADFPGGVRLGATNPSQFQIEFFVNDLGKPGASTFETLGGFEYNQNGCINLLCVPEDNVRKIPTDGLVLRGWYTTITLAVYGTLTANITEQIITAVVTPSLPAQGNAIPDCQQIISQNPIETTWQEPLQPIEYTQQPATQYPQPYVSQDNYQPEYNEYYDVPKDPRSYIHHTPETDWESKSRSRSVERDRERSRDSSTFQTGKPEVDHEHTERRDRERRYSRSHSRDRTTHDFRDREKDHDRDWDHDYRDHDKDWNRDRDRDRDRDSRDRYKHSDYRRYSDREERKRPRTPPIHSPKRPHTPIDHSEPSPKPVEHIKDEEVEKPKVEPKAKEEPKAPVVEENTSMDVEEFEPILSDEDILDDPDNFQDLDYDYTGFTNNDDLIKLFIPGTTVLQQYSKKPLYSVENGVLIVDKQLKNVIGIAEDFFRSSITKYTRQGFDNLNAEFKEEFIHLSEKVSQIIQEVEDFIVITEIYSTVTVNDDVITQIDFIVKSLLNWLEIALDFDMANAQEQPAYKIRHIKCGIKLGEWCSESSHFIELLWKQNIYLDEILLGLYEQEYMALSIKLMILKALDKYLLIKSALEKFVLGLKNEEKENGFHNLTPFCDKSGYKLLINMIANNPSVRLKFALTSILKKLNLFEALYNMRLIVMKIFNNEKYTFTCSDVDSIIKTLEYVLHLSYNGPFELSQPKRFLPVASQFEITRSECRNVLIDFLKMQNALEVFVLLLTSSVTMISSNIKTLIYRILNELTLYLEGLNYLSSNIEITNMLLKLLLNAEEDAFTLETHHLKSHQLGLKIAYKLQALYHVENLMDLGEKMNFDYDSADILDQFHGLFCLTFSNIGKMCCAEVLGMKNNIDCLLQFVNFNFVKQENVQMKMRKSPGLGYVIDLIGLVIMTVPNIPLLETYHKQFLEIVNQQDLFEPSTSMKIIEFAPFLKPYETYSGSYDVGQIVELISKCPPNTSYYSEVVITCLRILQYIGISKNTNKNEIVLENPIYNFTELKYKHVILQLFPLDGIGLLVKVLSDICDFYEQPNLHASVFVSNQGICLINVIMPSIELLKQMLTYVIQCRNTHFKDLTALPVLLQTYNLCQAFPINALGYFNARKVCKNIVDILLVYTQPVNEEMHEKDSLNKTLWSMMCGEIIKYTLTAPYTFMSGLSVFSEILPLPLPIQTAEKLNENEINWATNLRKLWSAHLHSHSANIQELVSKLCTTTYQPLLNLLRKVCVQISDLAANSALMIARGMLDNVHSAIVISDDVKKLVCNGHIARLMNFFACLVTHSSLKCTFMHLLANVSGGKGDEKYPAIIQAFAQILRSTSNVNSHVQTQECILSILQSFCDTEITLYQNLPKITPEVYLANAIPAKEHLVSFLNTMLDHISDDNSFLTFLPVLRTLLLLTEHDYGFYHLRESLLKRPSPFEMILKKLEINVAKENTDCFSTLNTLVEFLRVCTEPEEVESDIPFEPRKMKMSISEIQTIIGWKLKDQIEHPLVKIDTFLKKFVEENSAFSSLVEGLQATITLLKTENVDDDKDSFIEHLLPSCESLLIQFSGRPMFTSNEKADERLTTAYWLSSLTEEPDGDLENVTCDLNDICRQELSPEINLIKQVERLCKVCPSENSETAEKEKRTSTQKDKMKRPFVTPVRGRGFARTIQVRSDLFRSRPPNTSRPPSLHVDDFVALETCGAQPTGPTGYNKISRELLATSRASRGTRGRAIIVSERAMQYRQMSWWGPGSGRPY